MVYTTDVAKSFEIGAIREFIDQGLLSAFLFFGSAVPAAAIEVLDEGTQLTPTATSLNFVGSGVTATNVGDAVLREQAPTSSFKTRASPSRAAPTQP